MCKLDKIIMRAYDDKLTRDELSSMIEKLLRDSPSPEKYEMKLYTLENGYHFNEEYFNKSMSGTDIKWSPDVAESIVLSSGVKFSDCVTKWDIAYVMNMLYKMYYPLISDSSTAAKFTEKYINSNYPIPFGRAFAEKGLECKLGHKAKIG